MNQKYRPVVYKHGHPLANKYGAVRKSRFVLYEKQKGISGKCHWCGIDLNWKILCADHLDSNMQNNNPDNIVSSCRGCNANRCDGTNFGRRKPIRCKICKNLFFGHKKRIYCSNFCSFKDRPKRGNHVKHGQRSRYNLGCRCLKCNKSNITYWRIWYKKHKLKRF